jgi:uncharacterized membrane protein YcaP (DUF421 family)
MPEPEIWMSDLDRLSNVALLSLYFFLLTVVLFRLMGKRLTSQMNNFDWIMTVAIGSLIASAILLRDVSAADVTIAVLALAGCQYLFTWLAIRSDAFARVVRATPRLLTHKGEYLEHALRKERISKAEIAAKLREAGYKRPEDANWVILETTGKLSIIPRQDLEWSDFMLGEDVKADWEQQKRRARAETSGSD